MSTSKAIGLTILASLGLVAVGIGIWALTVAWSGVGGSGQVHKDQNSSTNREHWSATYNTDYSNLQADKANISVLQSAASSGGATKQDQINLDGAVMNCATDVAAYNADAQNVLGNQWIPAGLPTSVNVADYCSTN